MYRKVFYLIFIILIFTSCDMVFKKIVEGTATPDYLAKKFGYHIHEFYPRTCYNLVFKVFKHDYRENTRTPEKNKILSEVKYERNKLFIFSIDSNRSYFIPVLDTKFILRDNQNNIIKHQSFSYATRIITQRENSYTIALYRYEFLLVLEETLSKKTLKKDRWPVFLTITFPDKKYVKYKLY